mgnify:CR=1 FL=1
MNTGERILGALDLLLEAFFTACTWPFLGQSVWDEFPHSPYAHQLVHEMQDFADEIQGN